MVQSTLFMQVQQPTFNTKTKATKRELIGSKIECKHCQSKQAWICFEEKRLWVRCPNCAVQYLLKLQTV